MRFRHEQITDHDEQEAHQALHQLVTQLGGKEPEPLPDTYWSNLLVRSNQRIDDATSGKAISISWAARVAIPGVVAILSFFIGLHYYYVPEQPKTESSLTAVVFSIPDKTLDSLGSENLHGDDMITVAAVHKDLLQPSNDQLSEYFLETGKPSTLIETMSDEDVRDLLSSLGSRKILL